MKIIVTLLGLCMLFVSYPEVQAQNTNEALAYLDKVAGPLGDQKKETWQYLKAVTRGRSARKVEKRRTQLLAAMKESRGTVSRTGAFEGDLTLKNAVTTYLDLSYKVLKEDFDKILDMEAIAEQSYDAMEAYLLAREQAGDKLEEAWDTMDAEYRSFAASHNIEILEAEGDKTSEKINKSAGVLKYYNRLYLIFFKSYKQEAYILDAIAKGDVNALEQNIGAMNAFTQEGLEKLSEIDEYEGDNSLKTATDNMLRFYQSVAEKDYPQVVDFYLKKDNMEKLSKIMESKKKKDITQDDVDSYNAAVEDYNKAVKDVNDVNQTLNKKRSDKIDYFNKSIETFFDRHSG